MNRLGGLVVALRAFVFAALGVAATTLSADVTREEIDAAKETVLDALRCELTGADEARADLLRSEIYSSHDGMLRPH